jgi:hypothetical protein
MAGSGHAGVSWDVLFDDLGTRSSSRVQRKFVSFWSDDRDFVSNLEPSQDGNQFRQKKGEILAFVQRGNDDGKIERVCRCCVEIARGLVWLRTGADGSCHSDSHGASYVC